MFLITGITGKVGGAAAKHLLPQGKSVRALVCATSKAKSWADQGAPQTRLLSQRTRHTLR